MSENRKTSDSVRNVVYGDQINQSGPIHGVGFQKINSTHSTSTQPKTDIKDLVQEVKNPVKYVENEQKENKISGSQLIEVSKETAALNEELQGENTSKLSRRKIRNRLIAIVAIATTVGTLLANSTELVTNIFTLADRFGIQKKEINLPKR